MLGLLASCSGREHAREPTVEQITIESVEFPGRLWDPFLPALGDGTGTTVPAWLHLPAADEPAPLVIVEPGCGGLGAAHREWARDLAEHHIATLLVDSLRGRGVTEVCTGRETVNVADLIVDVYRAAETAGQDPRIDRSRIAVMGFSFGGRTALWSALTRFQDAYEGAPFRAYVAFYPSTCFIRLEDETDIAGGPIRIFHGTDDDWTPIEPCQELVDRLATDGVDARLHRYEGAHHAFDDRSLAWGVLHASPGTPSPRGCTFVERDGVIVDPDTDGVAGADSPCVRRGVVYGYDADARDRAEHDLVDFLTDTLAISRDSVAVRGGISPAMSRRGSRLRPRGGRGHHGRRHTRRTPWPSTCC
jgi:dienelactone hydrolase